MQQADGEKEMRTRATKENSKRENWEGKIV